MPRFGKVARAEIGAQQPNVQVICSVPPETLLRFLQTVTESQWEAVGIRSNVSGESTFAAAQALLRNIIEYTHTMLWTYEKFFLPQLVKTITELLSRPNACDAVFRTFHVRDNLTAADKLRLKVTSQEYPRVEILRADQHESDGSYGHVGSEWEPYTLAIATLSKLATAHEHQQELIRMFNDVYGLTVAAALQAPMRVKCGVAWPFSLFVGTPPTVHRMLALVRFGLPGFIGGADLPVLPRDVLMVCQKIRQFLHQP